MRPIALFLPSLHGGGAERVMVILANGFATRGYKVDFVLAQVKGSYLQEVSKRVRIVNLNTSRMITSLPGLVRYLRREQPAALLSAMGHTNVVALAARMLAGVSTRIVVSEHSNFSASRAVINNWRDKFMIYFLRVAYPHANKIVTVSKGIADNLSETIRIPSTAIKVIYNPVMMESIQMLSQQKLNHPWLQPGQPKIILGAGRLTMAKNFSSLIIAFEILRKKRDVRLIILGEGNLRHELEELVYRLELDNQISMPGFVTNPYAYMRLADVFVLSSAWEGFGNVLAEAMACGTPVVSTDCPSGPREILENGRWGRLVPINDPKALAEAISATLDESEHPNVATRAAQFNINQAVDKYLDVLGICS